MLMIDHDVNDWSWC